MQDQLDRLPEANNPRNPLWKSKWLRLDLYCASIQEMADKVADWTAEWFNNTPGAKRHLIIVGDTGCGKTHSAESVFKWVRAARFDSWDFGFRSGPPRVEWVEFAQVASLDQREFKAWLDDQADYKYPTNLLFLEDVGSETDQFKSQQAAERLREILNVFKDRWLFITTNVPASMWQEKWDARVEDRLYRSSVVVDLMNVKPYSMVKR